MKLPGSQNYQNALVGFTTAVVINTLINGLKIGLMSVIVGIPILFLMYYFDQKFYPMDSNDHKNSN